MDKDGKTTLSKKFKGLKVSLMVGGKMPEGEAVMVVSQKDFDRLKPKERPVTQFTSDQNYLSEKC